MRWVAYGLLGMWLIAAVGITLAPEYAPRFEGIGDRFEVESIIPLAGTIESFGNMRDRVMTPTEYEAERERIARDFGIPLEEVNLDPVVRGISLSTALRDPLGNVLLFIPAGFLAPLALNGRGWRRIAKWGAALSGVIELTQIVFAWGSLGTIDDVIFNTLGAIAGYGIWGAAASAVARLRQPA